MWNDYYSCRKLIRNVWNIQVKMIKNAEFLFRTILIFIISPFNGQNANAIDYHFRFLGFI